jgi:hypothetical protein
MKRIKSGFYVLIGLLILFMALMGILANERNDSLEQPIPTATRIEAPIEVVLSQSDCYNLPEGVFSLVEHQPGCPSTSHPRILPEAWPVEIIYQPFERGATLWVSGAGIYPPQLYVFDSDNTYRVYYLSGQEGSEAPENFNIGEVTAEAINTDGRFQSFLTPSSTYGGMIWISQRQEIYTLQGGTYQIISSIPTFALPPSAPPDNAAALILGQWKDSILLSGSPTIEFLDDGTILFDDCTGSYELVEGGKIHINADGCESAELPTGLYEYTVDTVLTLSQRFYLTMVLVAGYTWGQEDNNYEIELSSGGIKILGEDDCYGSVEAAGVVSASIDWSECRHGEKWLASAPYKLTHVGQELFLTRRFERVDAP